jgi:asparagine synthase (glutamine-hydrolysing)
MLQWFMFAKQNHYKGMLGFFYSRLGHLCGEIFNYLEMKLELEKSGVRFFTALDTEVILQVYRQWGEKCLAKFNGMWAFVIYDQIKNQISSARDRFGIRPLFIYHEGVYFSFASEINALLTLPLIQRKPHLPAIKDYLYYSRVNTSQYTFFEGITKISAGRSLSIDLNRFFSAYCRQWWQLESELITPPPWDREIIDQFRELLLSVIKIRFRSDMPVGTCLSSGLDSSAIVCLANPYLIKQDQQTFSIVQPNFRYNESEYIDAVIGQTEVTSFKRTINGIDLLNDLDRLIYSHDESFTSTSMYAQWKVFEIAKINGVNVAIGGQEVNEWLAGYTYFKMVYWAELLKRLEILTYANEIYQQNLSLISLLFNFISSFSGSFSHRFIIAVAGIADKQYLRNWINHAYFRLVSLPHAKIGRIFSDSLNQILSIRQRLYEAFTYEGLPAWIRYADRNSMIHSLDSRMPFLDYRRVSFLFSLPANWKIRQGLSRYILRQSLAADVPTKILARRDKIGFITAEAQLFRNETSLFLISSPLTICWNYTVRAKPMSTGHCGGH